MRDLGDTGEGKTVFKRRRSNGERPHACLPSYLRGRVSVTGVHIKTGAGWKETLVLRIEMAVNVNVAELHRAAENDINCIIEVLNKDKRTDKKWCETILQAIKSVKETLDVFRDNLVKAENTPVVRASVPSYSSIISQRKEESKSVVVVTPKDLSSVTDSEQTLQLMRAVTNNKLNVGVNRVKKTRNKSVVIELRNNTECQEFVHRIETSHSNLTAKIPLKRNPRIMIHGIDISFPEDELVDSILHQNPHVSQCIQDPKQELKIQFVRRARDGGTKYAVLEVSPPIYHAAISSEKLYIGYSRCPVKAHVHVIRCYTCSGYGHVAADCRSQKRCSYCSEEHDASECPKQKVECANCKQHNFKLTRRGISHAVNVNHQATSTDCPVYQKIVQIIKSKINYG